MKWGNIGHTWTYLNMRSYYRGVEKSEPSIVCMCVYITCNLFYFFIIIKVGGICLEGVHMFEIHIRAYEEMFFWCFSAFTSTIDK